MAVRVWQYESYEPCQMCLGLGTTLALLNSLGSLWAYDGLCDSVSQWPLETSSAVADSTMNKECHIRLDGN